MTSLPRSFATTLLDPKPVPANRPEYWKPNFLQWCLLTMWAMVALLISAAVAGVLLSTDIWYHPSSHVRPLLVILLTTPLVPVVIGYMNRLGWDAQDRQCYLTGWITMFSYTQCPGLYANQDLIQLDHRSTYFGEDWIHFRSVLLGRPSKSTIPSRWHVHYLGDHTLERSPVEAELQAQGWKLIDEFTGRE